MKRTLTIILALIMLVAALASCAGAPAASAAVSPRITLTSSDAEDAAAWLTARLDSIPDCVVLGTSADKYGVDVSALENDGYVIRNLGGEVALFARTADGLDRAVREYAKTVEAGSAIEDVTYHEGCRVKRVELAGRDIAEYTVYCEDERYMLAAAREFADRIAEACGAALAVSTEAPSAPYIALKYVHDDALSTVGYRWAVTDGGLAFECSDGFTPTAAHYAVARWLENELGWFGLTFGYESLAEADLVSIDAGESGGETNAFLYVYPYGDYCSEKIGDGFDHLLGEGLTGNMSGMRHCCHGFANSRFAQDLCPEVSWNEIQPCWLDEELYEVSLEDIADFIERKLASGQKIGVDFFMVDIAQGDSPEWCRCRKCRKMFADEGGTEAGAVLTWANRVSEALNETYPGLLYGVFAYSGTNKLPKTIRPNSLLWITYCYDGSCDSHTHGGANCEEGRDLLNHYDYGSFPHLRDHNNFYMARDLREWTAVSDNVCVWYYSLPGRLTPLYTLQTVRDDMIFFREAGVKALFWQAEDYGFSPNKPAKWLMSGLIWNIDMTDEEYEAYSERVFGAIYGDAWEYVKGYSDAACAIYKSGPCLHCWNGFGYVVESMWEKRFDGLYELIAAALPLANDAKQETRIVKLFASCVYAGCLSSYYNALRAGDAERVAELNERYELAVRLLAEHCADLPEGYTVCASLDDEAWSSESQWHYKPTLRPATDVGE